MKRNILEKFQRINEIRQQYSEQVIDLVYIQCEIFRKVVNELGLRDDNKQYFRYDSVKIDEDGEIGLYEYDRYNNCSYEILPIYLNPLILNGDKEGYEKYLRESFKAKAQKASEAKVKEKEQKRERLENELLQIRKELEKLGP